MVAYSFKKQFGPPILAGTKAQTIRAERVGRSRHARPGERVQLYTGMRTRQCRRLGESQCTEVLPVRFAFSKRGAAELMQIGERYLITRAQMDAFAQADGFDDLEAMAGFWWAEHPPEDGNVLTFEGVLIRWQALVPDDALDIAGAA
ncbi:hypothetical protein [Methylobacterium sp. J-076]|uniref:hypothetical protein n=1 Tax=Methylobacterium sp. J-076 TaxID=2836655 RepID=UPI001FBBE1B8|nr:hypothetical protein [Methylobacterium sp. J-076]MCJ2015231.1 hypothetical protein [Methylobacterium sp. J-076]